MTACRRPATAEAAVQFNHIDTYNLHRALQDWECATDPYTAEDAMRRLLAVFGDHYYRSGPDLQNRMLCFLARLVLRP